MADDFKPIKSTSKAVLAMHAARRKMKGGCSGADKTGTANVQEEEIKRLQALQAINKRVQGKSYRVIGEEMNVSSQTIKDRLDWAKSKHLFQEAEERIINELVPSAINAFKKALDEGMYEAARDVLFGTGLLSRNPERAAEHVEMTLEMWRAQRKKASIAITTNNPSGPSSGAIHALGELAALSREDVGEEPRPDSVEAEILLPFDAPADEEI